MERTIKFNSKNITFYFLGFFILGLGINLMLRANLGAGPWDTVTANLKAYLDLVLMFDVTLGTVSFVIAVIMMAIVLLYTRKWVLLGMVFPIFIVAISIDFWDLVVLGSWEITDLYHRLFFSVLGGVLIPLGLSFVIASHFPAFVFDELTLMLMKITGIKSMTVIRVGIEALGVTLGIVFGVLAEREFNELGTYSLGAVGPASIIVVLMLPPLLELFVKFFDTVTLEQFKRHVKNICFYVLGTVFISLGVVLMLRSNIGNSSWDSLHFSLHKAFDITVGTATIIVAVIVTFVVMMLNKHYKYIFMFVPIFLVGGMIDFFNLIALKSFEPDTLLVQIPTFIIGISILPLGGSLLIISSYPAGVFDELMLVIARKLHTEKIVVVRVIMELSAVTLAFIIGFSVGIGFGKIGIGTLIFSFSVGAFVRMYLKMFERMNLYENQQIN